MKKDVLKQIGFTDKQTDVYISLLSLGPNSVRSIAEHCDINRQSVHEILKWLQEQGLATWYHKEKKQYFIAEDPQMLNHLVNDRKTELDETSRELEKAIPELRAIHHREDERPVAKYYSKKG
ncbi:MAG: helix-turn-helix domain-containing protein, partial [Patescibacteria group bacterium]